MIYATLKRGRVQAGCA